MLVEDSIQDVYITIWKKKASLQIEYSILFYFIRALRRRILKESSPFLSSQEPEELQDIYSTPLNAESRLVEAEVVHERSH